MLQMFFFYLCSQLIGETSANAPPGLRAAMPLFLPCSWRYIWKSWKSPSHVPFFWSHHVLGARSLKAREPGRAMNPGFFGRISFHRL